MNEYPKISHHKPGSGSEESFARIDFSGRSFAHFIKEADEDEQPRFFSVGRDENNDRTSISFEGLTNNDIRAFAEEILRQFPETTPDPEPEYLIVIDGGGDEWVPLAAHPGEFALKSSYETRAGVSSYSSEAYDLGRITEEYGVKAVRIVIGEEPV